MDDLERFKTSVEEVTAGMMETARQIELEVELGNMIELLQSHDKILASEKLLVIDEQTKYFLEMEPTPGEDDVKIAETTAKDLEYFTN